MGGSVSASILNAAGAPGMAKRPRRLPVLAALALALVGGPAHAQRLLEGSGKLAQYYGAPYQTRMKWLLEGARVQPLTNGLFLITDAKLQTFGLQGERELAVQTPQCLTDTRQGTVSSPGPLRAQFADGKFALEGEGFLWRQTNSDLIISNGVRTVLHPDLLGRPSTNAAPPADPIEILSRQFECATNLGRAVWRQDVRVTGANLGLTSGVLQALWAPGQRRLEGITAEQNVSVDYAGIRAAGEAATYSADTDQVRVSGHPTWRAHQRQGSGDELVLERTNGVLRANGHARLQMSGQALGGSGLFHHPGSAAATPLAARDRVLEVLSDSYVLRTNLGAVFRGHVQVSQRAGAEVEGTMNCGLLTAAFSQNNQLERMTAENQVVIRQKDQRSPEEWQFSAGQAVFNGADGVLALTENPKWQFGLRQGSGDLIALSTKPEEMLVRGSAFMRLPPEALAQPAALSPGALGRAAAAQAGQPVAAAAPGATNRPFAEITAQEYTLTPEEAVFQRQVHIKHPQMDWTCRDLTVQMSEAPNPSHILAEGAVAFELTDAKGEKLQGTGDKADYTYGVANAATNEVVVLTGTPARLNTQYGVKKQKGAVENKVVFLDLTHSRVATPGKYSIRIEAPPMNTNAFQLPKGRFLK